MSDFLTGLPWEIFRKIYRTCSTETKWNLTKCLRENGKKFVIKNSGIHNYREILPCFCCQLSIFYDDFCQSDVDRSSLGFHFLYRPDIDFHNQTDDIHVSCYRLRRNDPEDRAESDNILKYFEDKLSRVFATTDVAVLRKHVETEHASHGYLPVAFWEANAIRRQEELEAVSFEHQNLSLLPQNFEWPDIQPYTTLVEEHKYQLMAAKMCVTNMLDQLEECQNIGASWEPIYLEYGDDGPQLWPGFTHVQSFRLFCDIIDRAHNISGDPDHKSIGKLFQNFNYKKIKKNYSRGSHKQDACISHDCDHTS